MYMTCHGTGTYKSDVLKHEHDARQTCIHGEQKCDFKLKCSFGRVLEMSRPIFERCKIAV
eukprot:4449073-Pleurochrysis_carterae.AAC.1